SYEAICLSSCDSRFEHVVRPSLVTQSSSGGRLNIGTMNKTAAHAQVRHMLTYYRAVSPDGYAVLLEQECGKPRSALMKDWRADSGRRAAGRVSRNSHALIFRFMYTEHSGKPCVKHANRKLCATRERYSSLTAHDQIPRFLSEILYPFGRSFLAHYTKVQ